MLEQRQSITDVLLLSDMSGLKADLSQGQHIMNHLTHQCNTKSKEYDRLGLNMVATTTDL
jgi:hypothetical protein